ncbi:MAG: TolB family protein [Pyrinomonadaceae bacterium]
MKLFARTLTLLLLLSALAQAQGGKRMTIEDALAFRDVSAPQWSPDGRMIAFTVSEWNRKEDRRDSHIYVIPATGGELVRLTNGERGETQPRWSPDSTRIAFLANRDAPAAGATRSGSSPCAGARRRS